MPAEARDGRVRGARGGETSGLNSNTKLLMGVRRSNYLDLCARSARTFRTRENLARTHAANAALAGSGAAAATAAEAAKYGPGS